MVEFKHNYQRELHRLLLEGRLALIEGDLNHIEVRHDSWCGVFKGDNCNCDPEIVVRKRNA